VFLLNLEIGYMTPPVGLNLFIASFRFNKPITQLYRSVLPFIGLLGLALIIVTYIPALSTWLPNLVESNAVDLSDPGEPSDGDDVGFDLDALEGDDETLDLDALEGDDETLDLDALEGDDEELDLDALEGDDEELDLDALEGDDEELDLDALEGDPE
ncbi:MAG: TRAP transporter large permease subunit, partial [Polyangiales bacterium]